jgi:hypothetical protein
MPTGYLEVEPAALGQLAGRLMDTVAVAQQAARGSGWLKGSIEGAGHDLVRTATGSFLDRWAYGCECLVVDARQLADRLRTTSRVYVATETAIAGGFSGAR